MQQKVGEGPGNKATQAMYFNLRRIAIFLGMLNVMWVFFGIIYAQCDDLIQGPVVGGFLARSASKYETTQVSFFCMFPYELPCLVGAALGILAFIGRRYILNN